MRALAAAHDLSLDWLVGLSNAGPVEAELLPHTSFESPGPSPTDEHLLGWLGEAADYKIRYVPSTLPDLLKTDAVIRFERARADGPERGADDRHDGGPAGVGPPPRHRDGVLLVDAGAGVVRHGARGCGAGSASRPGASSSTG